MMNGKSTRVLIPLVLAAVMCTALGSEALAAARTRSTYVPTSRTRALKPLPGPLTGEPDTGGSSPAPPKDGPYPTGAQLSTWVLRVQWSVRLWLEQLPKRYP